VVGYTKMVYTEMVTQPILTGPDIGE